MLSNASVTGQREDRVEIV